MLLITAGMQKAGSSWHCNMVGELAVRAGHEPTRDWRDRAGLQDVLGPWHTPGVGRTWGRRLRRIDAARPRGLWVVFKTHERPWPTLRRMLADGRARASYVYRDPRDVVISAGRHGERQRAGGDRQDLLHRLRLRGFGRLTTPEVTARWVRRRLLPTWDAWSRVPGVLMLKYEDLNRDPAEGLRRSRDHFGIPVDDAAVAEVAEAFKPESLKKARASAVSGALHLDAARVGRHKEMLSDDQIAYCERLFAPWLAKMGYKPHAAAAGG